MVCCAPLQAELISIGRCRETPFGVLNRQLSWRGAWFNQATERCIRLLITHLRGFNPYGQFFTSEKISNVGLKMQFEP